MDTTQTATKYQTYPKYKSSGIDWLGNIPEEWEVKRLKYLCNRVADYGLNIGAENYLSQGVRFIRTSDIDDDGILSEEGVYLDPELVPREYMLSKGDVLLSRSGTIGRSYIYDNPKEESTYAGYLVRFRLDVNKLESGFAYYFFHSQPFFDWIKTQLIETTIRNVNGQKYANIPFQLPLLPEQRSIADFLDRKSAKIDEVVGKKQKLIELLKEKRQALITRAVTKGLDPKAKMKPSGIDGSTSLTTSWLGDIPEEWEVKKLKYVAKSNVSSLTEDTAPDYLLKYLDIGNVGTGYILEEPMEMYFENAPSRARRIVKKNDTIISTVRTYLKAIYHFEDDPKDLIVSTGFAVIEAGKEINPKFFYYLSLSENFIDSIVSNSYGVSYPAINESFLMTLPAWYPKIETQKEIVAFLDYETAKIDEVMKKVEIQVEKLQEYRQALISNVVTGKVRVAQTTRKNLENVVQYNHGN